MHWTGRFMFGFRCFSALTALTISAMIWRVFPNPCAGQYLWWLRRAREHNHVVGKDASTREVWYFLHGVAGGHVHIPIRTHVLPELYHLLGRRKFRVFLLKEPGETL